jgi:site-specific recombinase XerD
MLDDLRRRNYRPDTIRGYIREIRQLAEYFGRSPDQLGAEHVRRYQIYLLHEKKLAPGSVENCVSAFTVSLQTHFEAKKSGVRRSTLPQATSQPAHRAQSGRGDKLIEMTGNRMHCTILMLLYATGLRRAEASRLKVSDIDSQRMIRLRAP